LPAVQDRSESGLSSRVWCGPVYGQRTAALHLFGQEDNKVGGFTDQWHGFSQESIRNAKKKSLSDDHVDYDGPFPVLDLIDFDQDI
jgi:hypothetical protein